MSYEVRFNGRVYYMGGDYVMARMIGGAVAAVLHDLRGSGTIEYFRDGVSFAIEPWIVGVQQ
jgi:hypothetical protein